MAVAPPRTRHLNVAVIGDTHLGTNQCRAVELLEYLDSITPDTLVLLGDIIDVAALRQSKLSQDQLAVLRRIIDFTHDGAKVYYLTGNHDSRIGRFGTLALGNLHVRNELLLQFDGRKTYFFHGDRLDAVVKYKLMAERLPGFWRKLLTMADHLGGRVKQLFGRQRWSLAAEVRTNPARAKKYVQLFERAAVKLGLSKGCDHTVCAHIHQPKIEMSTAQGKVVTYLNCGDWVSNLTALEYRFGKWSLYRYDEHDFPKTNKRLRPPMDLPNKSAHIDQELLRELLP
jgi:UDP-2,3-diacylglucosamine pyrophosphatase LpxH